MAVPFKAAQSQWVDEPTHTTPLSAARLNYERERTDEIAKEVERMIAAGAVTSDQYGVTGNGTTDDTTAMKNFLKACKERAGVILPGVIRVKATLPVPVLSEVYGLNGRSTTILREGNGDLFDLEEGGQTMRNFRVEATAEQASGAAFELTGAGGTDVRIDSITLSHNFFNGFSLIPTTLGGSIHVSRIRVVGTSTGVKGMKGSVFVLGNSTNRLVNAVIEDISGVANTRNDIAKWIEANNCDSCEVSNVLFQNGLQGVVVGNNDTSAERSTNMIFNNVIVDGGVESMNQGWFLSNLFASNFAQCHGQGAEVYLGENLHGGTWLGGTMQVCRNNGLRIGGAAGSPFAFIGAKIGNNNITEPAGTATNAEGSPSCADVLVENGAARVVFDKCFLGNVFNYGGVCRSFYPFWMGQGAKTGNGTLIVNDNCVWVQGGNSTKAFLKYEFKESEAVNKIYGFGGVAIPTPIIF